MGSKRREDELTLRVSEAAARDVGRGIARLDPQDLEALGAEVGDILQVTGKRASVVRAMPAHMEHRGQGLLQIDGIVRDNCQVALGERVKVEKVSHRPAQQIVLSPLGAGLRTERDARYLGRLLDGLPVLSGDRVRATLFGSRTQDFTVAETAPKGPVLIQPATSVKLLAPKEGVPKAERVSYEDIGGLHREIQRIREMIELPLRYPEVFERLGIGAPKGVLLLGPPGCGKTLIARAVANETEAYFIHVNGPEIIHKFYGESEADLRARFEDARRHAPAIIFLDEIDAIAPKRAEVTGEVEKRVVAQLLALMDGLEARGQVVVIGATNIPDSLDPALRRPGRFDREISLRIPDKNARLEILQIHTRGVPITEDVDLQRLAETTHGFVGADLEALCREAAMAALRRVLPRIQFDALAVPPELLMELNITHDDFETASKEVEPSAIREVFVEVPDVGWEDVGGLESAKSALVESIEWPIRHAELFSYAGLEASRGILLHGPPGTGKTLLAKAVANECEVNFIPVKGPALLSKWVGESERAVREIFRKARQSAPCILFFDEIDALAPRRGVGAGESHVAERVMAQLLTELDGIEELKGVVVLGATNRLDLLDPALLRPGRFDLLIKLPLPDEDAREAIFRCHTRHLRLDPSVDPKGLADAMLGMTGADIAFVCQRAGMLALRDFLSQNPSWTPQDLPKFKISQEHFKSALPAAGQASGALPRAPHGPDWRGSAHLAGGLPPQELASQSHGLKERQRDAWKNE